MPSYKKNTRMCCACRAHDDKSVLIRFVRLADGSVERDDEGRIKGRGVYVHDNAECKQKCVRKKLLSAAFKQAVDEDLYRGLQ